MNNILTIYQKFDFNPQKIIDLGCGTGKLTNKLAKENFIMTGIDRSEEMLAIANEEAFENNLRVRYLNQDMRSFQYNKTVDSVISICDGINYIITEEDLKKVFSNVYNVLVDGGLFIFDISTAYKLKNTIGNNIFVENHDDFSYIWDNTYDPKEAMLSFELTIFIKENGLFERFIEHHQQKAHSVEKLTRLLEEQFKMLDILDAETLTAYKNNSERIYFIVRKDETDE
jgi:cyclopropane fatty-acyl-phospholipid synthase-like methyltransferase